MDLKHKLKDLVMSEFAYDLSKYEDEGESKVNNVTDNLVKLFSLYIVSQGTELLPEFLMKDSDGKIVTAYIGGADVTKEWNEYLGNCG